MWLFKEVAAFGSIFGDKKPYFIYEICNIITEQCYSLGFSDWRWII